MPLLTIGMATYNDFNGVYFSIQALRLYHDLTDVELIVVDNFGCEQTQAFVEKHSGARYILATEIGGTAAPRDRIFAEATGDFVLCMDSHVLLAPNAIQRLKHYCHQHPDTNNLLQGPIWFDELTATSVSTHFSSTWADLMEGHWETDERGIHPDQEPFEIPNMGLGLFVSRREAWPGFNPLFRGFGGEEGYLHEKVRQRGDKTLCLPFLRWVHRFGRPGGTPYSLTFADKARNHIIGHVELGRDLGPLLYHISAWMPSDEMRVTLTNILAEVYGSEQSHPYDVDALMNRVEAYGQFLLEIGTIQEAEGQGN